MKKFLRLISAAAAVCIGLCAVLPASAEDSKDTVTLYALDEWAKEYIEIPSEYPQSYQISTDGGASFTVISGDSVEVSQNGLVTPASTTWYFSGSFGSTVSTGDPNERVVTEYNYGTSVVEITRGGKTSSIVFEVLPYSTEYAYAVMEKHIAQSITDSMSFEEKLDKICQLPASYDYSVAASGAVGMIITGGGDCWASTDMIVTLCEIAGIPAWSRNANMEPGAGSGHMNAVAYDSANDTYYIAEAGFAEPAPRYYSVTKLQSPFMHEVTEGGIELYQYVGKKTEKLLIPAEIGGYSVTSIGEDFLQTDDNVKEIVIPDTVKSIGDSAFNSCEALEKINIPAGVENIGDFVFTRCLKLNSIECDEKNEYFTAENGVLYTKDKKELLYCPAREELVIPETVETIDSYAFYYNENLKSVEIPQSVKVIGEGAFGNCENLNEVSLAEISTAEISDFSFYYCYKLNKILIPNTVTKISSDAFSNPGSVTIYGEEGSFAQSYAAENGFEFRPSEEYGREDTTDTDTSTDSDTSTDTSTDSDTDTDTSTDSDTPSDAVKGDVNGDGEVSIMDVVLSRACIVGNSELSAEQIKSGDMSGDGKLDIIDIVMMRSLIVNS